MLKLDVMCMHCTQLLKKIPLVSSTVLLPSLYPLAKDKAYISIYCVVNETKLSYSWRKQNYPFLYLSLYLVTTYTLYPFTYLKLISLLLKKKKNKKEKKV